MIQRTFDVRNEQELLWLADMKFYSDYTRAKTVFIQFYLSRFSAADAQKVLDVIRRELPAARVIGMSLYGDPFVGLNAEKLMRFNFCFFDESEVTILDYDGDKMPMEKIVSDFRERIDKIPDPKGVLLLGSGITFKASKFMDAVTAGHENIPFFGSIANINTADVDDQAPYAFGNNMVRNGIAAAIFSGKDLHFYNESLFSWNPIGKEMLVEAGEPGVVGDSVIKKIDGAPAVQIYKKYLNVDPDAHFISNICEFPIVVNRNGYLMARVPCGFNDEGELNTMGDVRDGEYIRFTYGKASEILSKTEEASLRMRDFAPEGIFLFACANRAIFLKACAHEEIDFYSRIAQDLVYCHGFSELYRYKGQGGVFNSQLVTIGLREGEAKKCQLRRSLIPGISFDNPARHPALHSHAHKDFFADKAPHSDSGADALLRDSAQAESGHSEQNKNAAYERLSDAGDKANERGGHSDITEMFTHTGNQLGIPSKMGFRPESSAMFGMASVPRSVMADLEERERENFEWTEAVSSGRLSPNDSARLSDFQRSIGVSIPIEERLVTFLEATTEELKKAEEAANAANEAKSAFLSSMSHEIRTPINAVLGLDEMILRESNEDHIKRYASDIQSSGRSLLSIINDILDFSKIEAGKMEIINADYDLRAVITDLANMVETRCRNKGLDFIVNVDVSAPHLLHGDETRIKQCALNILTNAVKYTHSGSVTLNVGFEKTGGDTILLKIGTTDTGIGIKEEDLPRLFKPFERIEEKRNRSIEGTGLGMSIVNGLLSQMGSKLEVKSVYGKGSDFSFAVEQKVRSWEAVGTREEAREALDKEAALDTESFQAPAARVLVIDDTPMNLTVIKGLLKRTRVKVDTASSGQEGVDLAARNKYDIIFVDHLMPKMDGIETLKALRALDKNGADVHCVALTANAVSGAKEMYLEAGFKGYLSKPIDSKKLEEMIKGLLPKELVVLPGDAGFMESGAGRWNGEERRAGVCAVSELFNDIFGLDIDEALKNCGTKEVFLEAAENFYDAVQEKSGLIEKYAESGGWKDYTILVHALKSSARLIGFPKLSELAKRLEEAGDRAQKGQADAKETIASETPKLLSLHRAAKATLAAILKKAAPRNDASDGEAQGQEQKPLAGQAQIDDALSALNELVGVFDFDGALAVIDSVEEYELPAEFLERLSRVKKAVRRGDAQAAREALSTAAR